MGLFTSKIFAGVLAGTIGAGGLVGLGLVFNGSDTLNQANSFVEDAKNRLVQFEQNENTLLGKIGSLKDNANTVIGGKNATIAELEGNVADLQGQVSDLEGVKAQLESDIADLNTQITALQASLDQETTDHNATKAQLAEKTAQYNAKVTELNKAKATITQLNSVIAFAEQKAKEGDKLVEQLEKEVQKANAEVQAHGEVVDTAKTASEGAQPLSQEEVDAVDTTVNE